MIRPTPPTPLPLPPTVHPGPTARGLTEFERGYFAATFASVGTVYAVARCRPGGQHAGAILTIVVSSSNAEIPRTIAEMFGRGRLRRVAGHARGPTTEWRVHAYHDLEPVLEYVVELVPRLRPRALLMLEFVRARRRVARNKPYSEREAQLIRALTPRKRAKLREVFYA